MGAAVVGAVAVGGVAAAAASGGGGAAAAAGGGPPPIPAPPSSKALQNVREVRSRMGVPTVTVDDAICQGWLYRQGQVRFMPFPPCPPPTFPARD